MVHSRVLCVHVHVHVNLLLKFGKDLLKMAALLYGWQRKFALVLLALFMVSWILFTVGLIWRLVKTEDVLPSHPSNFPYYITLCGGPVVYLLGLLHTILPGILSALVWFLVTFFSVIYSTSAGWTLYSSGVNATTMELQNTDTTSCQTLMMLVGTAFSLLFLCSVLVLSIFYKTRSSEQLLDYNEFQGEQRRCKNFPFTPGNARILSVPFIALSCFGWCVFVFGFHNWKPDAQNSYSVDLHSSGLPMIVVAHVITPFLLLASLLHAGCLKGAGNVMGVFESLLSMPFMISMGFVVIDLCEYFILLSSDFKEPNIYFYYMVAGGGTSVLFWACVLALWPFYGKYRLPRPIERPGRNAINNADNDARQHPLADQPVQPNYGAMQRPQPQPQPQDEERDDQQPLLGENEEQ